MRRQKKPFPCRGCLAAVCAMFFSAPLFADAGVSNRAVVLLRPDETSFWRTATNSVIAIPVDMPPLASSATLTVRGVEYEKSYGVSSPGDFILSLPPAVSERTENVYDLTLAFNDGTVRAAKIGVVRGYAAEGQAATARVLSPKGDAKWKGVHKHAVMPIPYGMASFAVNGVETDTELGGAQGWYALTVAPAGTATLEAAAGDAALEAALFGLYDGFIMSLR